MASSSNVKGVTRVEEAVWGENRNMTSLDSVEGSERADRGREGREAGGVSARAQNAWSRWFRIVGFCCFRADQPPSNQSWYYSARIQRMMEKRSEFSTKVEFEIKSSSAHWSEVDPAVSETEHSGKANREYFEVLRRRRYVRAEGQIVAKQLECIDEDTPSGLFGDWDSLVVGEKLAEGGQAEIYAARVGDDDRWAVKVFKSGSVLEHVEKQVPPALLKYFQFDQDDRGARPSLYLVSAGATLLRDERLLDRFAFVMPRYWGDLRTLIDEQMMESHNQGPPFPSHVVLHLMERIALDMKCLHAQDPPILHNGLKAANVLVHRTRNGEPHCFNDGRYNITVADFECSVGVVGTGIWRAPEILQQLKDKIPMEELVVRDKCDVYSFGMTCYEILSGHMPYEDCIFLEARELVLKGE